MSKRKFLVREFTMFEGVVSLESKLAREVAVLAIKAIRLLEIVAGARDVIGSF
jgi:hypothetical protein